MLSLSNNYNPYQQGNNHWIGHHQHHHHCHQSDQKCTVLSTFNHDVLCAHVWCGCGAQVCFVGVNGTCLSIFLVKEILSI